MPYDTSQRLIIFEGPDGVGKTTLSRALASFIHASYVHLGPFPRITDGALLSRMYLEAMMPAILGHASVVMDRSWVSEVPYGIAYRNGADRIGLRSRLLERLAWRCRTTFVHCHADWEQVVTGYRSRRGLELLENETQLREVFDWYEGESAKVDLPTVHVRPIQPRDLMITILHSSPSSHAHNTEPRTSGNLLGKALLVGEGFGDIAQGDPLYQSPFGSFVGSGCSLWLTHQLYAADIPESALMWANANQLTPAVKEHPAQVIALGDRAARKLRDLGRQDFHQVVHPQYHKRFHFLEEYPLIPILKEIAA